MLVKRLRASYLCDAVKLLQNSKNFLSVLPLNSVLDKICAASFRGKGAFSGSADMGRLMDSQQVFLSNTSKDH